MNLLLECAREFLYCCLEHGKGSMPEWVVAESDDVVVGEASGSFHPVVEVDGGIDVGSPLAVENDFRLAAVGFPDSFCGGVEELSESLDLVGIVGRCLSEVECV